MEPKNKEKGNWEHLENDWQNKLAAHEESLSASLLDKFEHKLAEKEQKRGFFIWINSNKWVAAASVFLGLLLTYNFWNQTDDLKILQPVSKNNNSVKQLFENNRVPQMAKVVFVAKKSNQHQSDLKNLKEDHIKVVESVKLEVIPNIVDVSGEKIVAIMPTLPTETYQLKPETNHLKPEDTPDTPTEEKIFVVEFEPEAKKNFFKKALHVIEKVKNGKIDELVRGKNKKEEGKMNDGIHQVVNKIVSTEENIKSLITL